MDFVTIRNKIVSGLYNYTNLPVIFTPTNTPIPNYPFITYNFISTYIDGVSHEELLDDIDTYVNNELVTQSEFTLSFNSYSKDAFESKDIIKQVYDYFNHVGYYELKEIDLVVAELNNIENRDNLEVDEYERREGVDIRFRIVDRTSMRVETIETININNTIV